MEAAVAAGAHYLITGDKDLRDVAGYKGIKIRFRAEFLQELAETQ